MNVVPHYHPVADTDISFEVVTSTGPPIGRALVRIVFQLCYWKDLLLLQISYLLRIALGAG